MENKKLNNKYREIKEYNTLSEDDLNQFETKYNISFLLIGVASIRDLIDEFILFVSDRKESRLEKIMTLSEDLKQKLNQLDLSKQEYDEYYNKIVEFENMCNELYKKYNDFDYLMTKNGLERIKHINYEL